MPSRRSLLTAMALGLAGCSGGPGTTPTTEVQTRASTTSDTPTETPPQTVSHGTGTDNDGTPGPSDEPPTGTAVRWTVDVDGPVTERPTVSDDTLYVAGGRNDRGSPPSDRSYVGPETSQNLLAFGLDGTERWRYESAAGVGPPVVSGAAVYAVVGWNGGLSGIDQRVVRVGDGRQRWETDPVDGYLTILGTGDDAVFAGTSDDALGTSGERLFAFESDGSERWQTEFGDAFEGIVDGDTLYATIADQQTVALDTTDGSERWSFPAGMAGGEARVFDDTVYVDSGEQNDAGDYPLIAVDATDGTERWRYTTDGGDVGPFVVTGAVEHDGAVYATEYGGLLFAVDAADGTGLWRYETDGDTTSPPVVVGDTVFFEAGHDSVHAVDATTGEGRWSQGVDGRLHEIRATGSTVLAAGQNETGTHVAALGLDGRERWRFTYGGGSTSPVLDGDRVYLGTDSGYLVCLGP